MSNTFPIARSIMLALLVATATPCLAGAEEKNQSKSSQPSLLSETYDDWAVSCRRLAKPQDGATRDCNLSQTQVNDKQQRVLQLEMRPTSDGANGVMIVPFGLQLAAGVTLQVDTKEKAGPRPFETCLPAGCVVALGLDKDTLTGLRVGRKLNVGLKDVGGKPLEISVSLAGFAAAYDRAASLVHDNP